MKTDPILFDPPSSDERRVKERISPTANQSTRVMINPTNGFSLMSSIMMVIQEIYSN